MSPEPPLNPYAPPATEVGLSTEGEPALKRPPSVKWALVLFLFGFVVLVLLNGQLLAKQGAEAFLKAGLMEPWSILRFISRLMAVLALLFGGRRPAVYWITVFALAVLLCDLPGALATQWRFASAGREPIDAVPELVGVTGMAALLVWLFYRFTFGRASRAYFRVAKT